jgi:DNA repair exonuclease SbcCD ATPase subunit
MRGLNGVFGPNRSGKSSLLDIILFSIYGRCNKGKNIKNIVNRNSNGKAATSVVLKTTNGYYKIMR